MLTNKQFRANSFPIDNLHNTETNQVHLESVNIFNQLHALSSP